MIIDGMKAVENRSWRTLHRGTLAIHAAARVDRQGAKRFPGVEGPRGVILGTVQLIDVVLDSDSPWAAPGAWHWLLGSPCPWETPVPATGRLGLWTLTV